MAEDEIKKKKREFGTRRKRRQNETRQESMVVCLAEQVRKEGAEGSWL